VKNTESEIVIKINSDSDNSEKSNKNKGFILEIFKVIDINEDNILFIEKETEKEKEKEKEPSKHHSKNHTHKHHEANHDSSRSTNHNTPEQNNNDHPKRKKEKVAIVAKNKKSTNLEKKNLELIHKNNPNKEDYDLIYNIIDKHFFMQTLNQQARNEIIITMSLCKVKKNTTLFTQGSIGNYWYIVHEGKLEKTFDGKKKN